MEADGQDPFSRVGQLRMKIYMAHRRAREITLVAYYVPVDFKSLVYRRLAECVDVLLLLCPTLFLVALTPLSLTYFLITTTCRLLKYYTINAVVLIKKAGCNTWQFIWKCLTKAIHGLISSLIRRCTRRSPIPVEPSDPAAVRDQYGQSAEDLRSCILCFFHPKNVVLMPCRHAQFCVPCIRQLQKKQCPTCNEKISNTVSVYIFWYCCAQCYHSLKPQGQMCLRATAVCL